MTEQDRQRQAEREQFRQACELLAFAQWIYIRYLHQR